MLKDPRVACLADDLSDPMVIAATASGGLRHGYVSGTLGFPELVRIRWAGKGDLLFAYGGVAVANMDHANVYGRSSAANARRAGDQSDGPRGHSLEKGGHGTNPKLSAAWST